MCMFILEEKKLGKKVKSTPKLTYFQLNGKQKNRNLYFPAQNYDQFLHDLRYGVTETWWSFIDIPRGSQD